MTHSRRTAFLVLPAAVYLGVFFLLPVAAVVSESFDGRRSFLENYAKLLAAPVYLTSIYVTLEIAVTVTAICLVLSYPVSYYLLSSGPRKRILLSIVFGLPLWISVLVRAYAWIALLQERGLINSTLLTLHLIRKPLPLIYNFIGVVTGMIYVMLPIMIFSILSVMKGIDRRLLLVAQSLGIPRWAAFYKVFIPLSLRGVGAGCSLVFILSVGYFITPALLGGRRQTMISMLIEIQMNRMLDWGLGSALAVYLMLIVAATLMVTNKLFKLSSALVDGGSNRNET